MKYNQLLLHINYKGYLPGNRVLKIMYIKNLYVKLFFMPRPVTKISAWQSIAWKQPESAISCSYCLNAYDVITRKKNFEVSFHMLRGEMNQIDIDSV